ncbi:MAG: acyltransferase [Chthoniobacterales bacterium]
MNTAPAAFPRNWECIDLLRGLAILGVVFYHCIYPAFRVPPIGLREFFTEPWSAEHWLFPLTFSSIRIPLFFVISGFCIHWSWLRSKSWSAGRFFWRRFWRLYPAYLVALVCFILLKTGWPIRWSKHGWNISSHLLLFHNLDGKFFKSYNGAFWTLAIEVQLYALYLPLLALRRRFGLGKTVAGLFLLANVLRLVLLPWAFDDRGKIRLFLMDATLLHWFDWAIGAYLAEKIFRREPALRRWALWPLVLLWLLADLSPWTAFWKFTLASLIAASIMERLLLWEQSGGRLSRWPVCRWLSGVGVVSYSLYLWHLPLLDLAVKMFAPWIRQPWPMYAALNLLIVPLLLVLAWVSCRCLEVAGVKIGNRLAHRPARHEPDSPLVRDGAAG